MEQEQLSAEYFLASLSHELRTPLNGIVGYTQLLLNSSMTPTQRSYLNSMNHCCISLVEIINDILDFSKLSTNKMPINNECVFFKEIINEVNTTMNFRIKEKKQKCKYVLSDDLPEYIITDKQKLVQILINLVSNANKFTPKDGRIIIHILPADNNKIEFSVEDNGIGISKKDQENLFDAFYQVNESTVKTGCGLGLAITKKLIQLLGGDITVESYPDQGSVFTFTIKFEEYDEFKKNLDQNSICLKDKYILVVDDDIDNRILLSKILFDAQTIPIMCGSTREAMQYINSCHYNFSICLLDISMSGSKLAKEIKKISPDIPLIAMSSLEEPILNENFDAILDKPILKIKLIDTIVKIVKKNDISTCVINNESQLIENKEVKKDLRILIAEDVNYNMNLLIQMLKSINYTNIDTAVNGQKAIEKIDLQYKKNQPYDILLLDLKMPNVDGFGVIKHINEYGYKLPKIAVLTASVAESDKTRCRKMGIKYFILKPINLTHLKVVMKQLG